MPAGPRPPARCKFRLSQCKDSPISARASGSDRRTTRTWRPDGRAVDWLEVISENFMVEGGNPRRVLRAARARYPIVLHGVSMSLGSVDPLDERYLDALAALAREIEPAWISDHLCWSSFGGHSAHDLWPLPYTEEALDHVAARVARVQERLGRRILVENVSSYLTFRHSTMTEWEFLAALAERADCGLLLDVNNVFVSARNHGFDPIAFLDGVPRRARRAVPPRRPQRQGDAPARHARPSGVRRGLGAVSTGGRALRRGGDAARARRRHSVARRAVRGGATRGARRGGSGSRGG